MRMPWDLAPHQGVVGLGTPPGCVRANLNAGGIVFSVFVSFCVVVAPLRTAKDQRFRSIRPLHHSSVGFWNPLAVRIPLQLSLFVHRPPPSHRGARLQLDTLPANIVVLLLVVLYLVRCCVKRFALDRKKIRHLDQIQIGSNLLAV